MALIDLKKTTLKIQDGTSTANSITVKVGEGNITYSISREIEYRRDRGNLDQVREGEEQPVEVSFDIAYEFYISDGAEAVTPAEALQKIGAAAAWTTTGADTCEPYAVDLLVEYNINCGATKDERLTFSEYRWESLDFDIQAATISSSGSCNEVRPTAARVTL